MRQPREIPRHPFPSNSLGPDRRRTLPTSKQRPLQRAEIAMSQLTMSWTGLLRRPYCKNALTGIRDKPVSAASFSTRCSDLKNRSNTAASETPHDRTATHAANNPRTAALRCPSESSGRCRPQSAAPSALLARTTDALPADKIAPARTTANNLVFGDDPAVAFNERENHVVPQADPMRVDRPVVEATKRKVGGPEVVVHPAPRKRLIDAFGKTMEFRDSHRLRSNMSFRCDVLDEPRSSSSISIGDIDSKLRIKACHLGF